MVSDAAAINSFELTSHTYWAPERGRPSARGPLDFVFRAHAEAFTFYAWDSKVHSKLDKATWERFLKSANQALDDPGAVTGNRNPQGSYVTELSLWSQVRSQTHSIHHPSSFQKAPAPALRNLLIELVMRTKDQLSDEALVHFEFLLDRFEAPELPAPFPAGQVLKVPEEAKHFRVPIGEGIYLRIGQPPGPSPLYLLRPKDIQGLDILKKEGGRMQPVDHLPAERATVCRWRDETCTPTACEVQYITGETERPQYLVIERLDPSHGIYIQKYRGR